MDKTSIMSVLHDRPDMQKKLFIRGFLMTNDPTLQPDAYPFYGAWNRVTIGSYTFLIHPLQAFYSHTHHDTTLFLVGHCLNPFDSLYQEDQILAKLMERIEQGEAAAIEYLNQLTGSFLIGAIKSGAVHFVSDAAGMLFSCYGMIRDVFFLSSHPQLIADLYPVSKNEYTRKFENYKHFYKYGFFFPGDHTQYDEVKRVLQNHIMTFENGCVTHRRFYPQRVLKEVCSEEAYTELLSQITSILHTTLELVTKKWSSPAISLTGGMDSKTTLACANQLYDRFSYYSYVSMDGDRIDAEAAHTIAEHLGLKHNILTISENDEDFPDLAYTKAILEYNQGGYHANDNDIRKREFLSGYHAFDVEVKSWVSEIGRANYYKKFGLKRMPRHLTPRHMTSMFKIFTTQRRLAKATDRVFDEFIKKTRFHDFPAGYDESDMYLWEFRYSAWGGIVITQQHSYSSDILIPFNNRILLDLMLSAPLSKRISDEFHEDLIHFSNPRIDETGITVTNWNETKKRMYLERAYFLLHSAFRFL